GTQVPFEPRRGNHGAAETKLSDGPSQLPYRLFGLLQRNQRETLETRGLEIGIVKPIVPRPRQIDGEFNRDHFAKGKAAGRIKYGSFDSDIVDKFKPAVDTDLPEGTGDQLIQGSGMKVIQRRRQWPAAAAPPRSQIRS